MAFFSHAPRVLLLGSTGFLGSYVERFLIFRTRELMAMSPHPRNILFPILASMKGGREFSAFDDQWMTPVFVEDVANVLLRAMRTSVLGVFHVATKEVFTRYDLAMMLAGELGFDSGLIRARRMADLSFLEPRPTHNTLDSTKVRSQLAFDFTEIRAVLSKLHW